MKNNKNTEQDKQIAVIKTDIHWMRGEIKSIKNQVFNHIPTSIKSLKQELVDYKLSNNKWLISILISLIFVFVGLILNLIIK